LPGGRDRRRGLGNSGVISLDDPAWKPFERGRYKGERRSTFVRLAHPFPRRQTMRNTLAFLAGLVIVLAGVGFYLDWFNIRSSPTADGHKSFTLDVNTDKMIEDARKAEQNLREKNKKDEAPVKMPHADHTHDH
jgi:hypothetical protein